MKAILSCTDGSLYTDSVYQYTAWLAKALKTEVHLLHMLDPKYNKSISQDFSGHLALGAKSALLEKLVAQESANAKLALLSTTDGVTGIGNRRRFDERLATEWMRCGRHQLPLAVILIDIDHFKLYNDHYGHLAGDECLRRVAQLLQGTIRRADEVAARYGGEEFVLLLPDVPLPEAVTVAERCMASLREAALAHPRQVGAEVEAALPPAARDLPKRS